MKVFQSFPKHYAGGKFSQFQKMNFTTNLSVSLNRLQVFIRLHREMTSSIKPNFRIP